MTNVGSEASALRMRSSVAWLTTIGGSAGGAVCAACADAPKRTETLNPAAAAHRQEPVIDCARVHLKIVNVDVRTSKVRQRLRRTRRAWSTPLGRRPLPV